VTLSHKKHFHILSRFLNRSVIMHYLH